MTPHDVVFSMDHHIVWGHAMLLLETQHAEGVLSSKVSKKNAPIGARSQLGCSQKRWFIFRFLRRPLEILAEHTKI